MRRQSSGSRFSLTREKILQESARVFNRRGYHGTTLDDIARALGVTKAALYYYVKSKEELLYQCHQASLDIGIEGIRQAIAKASTPDEQLRIALAYYIEGMTDQLTGTVVLLDEGALSPRRHRRIIERRDEYERMLRKLIEEGIAAGVFTACDPKLVGFAILGAMNWIPKWYTPTGERSAKEIAEAFSAYLVRGLQKFPSMEASHG
jgi:TetR/AcrR family transcriptional regulator